MYFELSASIIFFVFLGRYLELRFENDHTERARLGLAPLGAVKRILASGQEALTPVTELKRGDKVVIPPGITFPVDGLIQNGSSSIDGMSLPGESQPKQLGQGEIVLAGQVNGRSTLVLEVIEPIGTRRIDQIERISRKLILFRSSMRSSYERTALLTTASFILIILFCGFLAYFFAGSVPEGWGALVASLAVGLPFTIYFARIIGFSFGRSRAAQLHAILTTPPIFECLASIGHVMFDKTGTLTTGKNDIATVEPAKGFSPLELLQLASQAHVGKDHPVAQALVASLQQLETATSAEAESRLVVGMETISNPAYGREVLAGSRQFLAARGISLKAPKGNQAANEVLPEVCVAKDGTFAGTIVFQDPVRKEASAMLAHLRGLGLRVAMLSGDRHAASAAAAKQLGLSANEWYGGMSPENKADFVRIARRSGKDAAFVGNGLGDVPALASASIGIAMPDSPALVRLFSDVELLSGGLEQLPALIALSRKVRQVTASNLYLAAGFQAAGAAALAFGLAGITATSLGLILALGGMGLNSMRLRRCRLQLS